MRLGCLLTISLWTAIMPSDADGTRFDPYWNVESSKCLQTKEIVLDDCENLEVDCLLDQGKSHCSKDQRCNGFYIITDFYGISHSSAELCIYSIYKSTSLPVSYTHLTLPTILLV